MLRRLDWRGTRLTDQWLRAQIPRTQTNQVALDASVSQLIEQVRDRGLDAVVEQTLRFDGVAVVPRRVDPTRETPDAALPTGLVRAIETSISRVRLASTAQMPQESVVDVAAGARIRQRFVPVERAGVYVPGGKAVYPSSVVMNVVAAQVAGVSDIALVSPPQSQWEGNIHPTIVHTAAALGVTEAYPIGGVAAIAALAYGLPEIDLAPVSVITGPGNRYVAAAKRLLSSVVGIDSEAGPTEICVIADHTAVADWVAADLVSQAEHDEAAQAVLITTDEDLARDTLSCVRERVEATPHSERVREALEGVQSAIILVDTLADALSVSDALAPEHLEIHTEEAWELATKVRHAGAVFVGGHTPVSLGDYLAGSNHVLPTGARAKFQSGLSALTFLRPQQVVEYTEAALEAVGEQVVEFARAENLPAHGDAITARIASKTRVTGG